MHSRVAERKRGQIWRYNIAKVISAILTTQRTENEVPKETKQIKPEEEVISTMVVEIFAH